MWDEDMRVLFLVMILEVAYGPSLAYLLDFANRPSDRRDNLETM